MPIRKRDARAPKRSLGEISEKPDAVKNREKVLDDLMTQRRQDFLGRFPEMSVGDSGLNRIVIPVEYLQGSPTGSECSLSMPGAGFQMRMPVENFKQLPADIFGDKFAKSHVALCLQPDVKEIPPVYRSDFDWTTVGKVKPVDVSLMANKFTEACTKEVLGEEAVRNMCGPGGEFNLRPVASCSDSYDCMAKTIQTGISPVQEWHEKVQATYHKMPESAVIPAEPESGFKSAMASESRTRAMQDIDAAVADITGPEDGSMSGPDYI